MWAYTLLNADEKCRDDEFDCDDGTCIKKELKCDGAVNCRFKTDEDESCEVSWTSAFNVSKMFTYLSISHRRQMLMATVKARVWSSSR